MKQKEGEYCIGNGTICSIGYADNNTSMVSIDSRAENIPKIHEELLKKIADKAGDNYYLKSFDEDGKAEHSIFTNLPPNKLLGELWDAKLITHDEMLEAHKGLALSVQQQMAPSRSNFMGFSL